RRGPARSPPPPTPRSRCRSPPGASPPSRPPPRSRPWRTGTWRSTRPCPSPVAPRPARRSSSRPPARSSRRPDRRPPRGGGGLRPAAAHAHAGAGYRGGRPRRGRARLAEATARAERFILVAFTGIRVAALGQTALAVVGSWREFLDPPLVVAAFALVVAATAVVVAV